MPGHHIIDLLLPAIADQRAAYVREHCRSNKDLLALAVLYAMQAQRIWAELGGNEHAAQQFYAIADRCATAQQIDPA